MGTTDGGDPATYSWVNINVQKEQESLPVYSVDVDARYDEMTSGTALTQFKEAFASVINKAYAKGDTDLIILLTCNRYSNSNTKLTMILYNSIDLINSNSNLQNKPSSLKFYTPIASGTDNLYDPIENITSHKITLNLSWNDNVATITSIMKFETSATYLPTTNTTAYTPTANYHPATKKYVDDSIASAITDALGGSY